MTTSNSMRGIERGRLRRHQRRELKARRKNKRKKSERASVEGTNPDDEIPSKLLSVTDSRPTQSRPTSEWWAHIRSGFVRDPSGKHHKALRQAVWLYLYFLVTANWKTGTLFRKTETIVAETGFSPRSVARWLGSLRTYGYVKTTSTGRSLTITITKWRPISNRGAGGGKSGRGP